MGEFTGALCMSKYKFVKHHFFKSHKVAKIRPMLQENRPLHFLIVGFTVLFLLNLCVVRPMHAQIPGEIPGEIQDEEIVDTVSEEGAVGGNINILISNYQFENISTRLGALRNTKEGLEKRGLASNVHGQTLHPNLYAGLLSDVGLGGNGKENETNFLSKLGFYTDGSAFFGDKDRTEDESSFDFDNYFATAGVDYKINDNLIIGTTFNYVNTGIDFDSPGDRTDVDTYNASIYGTYYVSKNFYIDGYGMYGWSDFDTRRNIDFSDSQHEQLESDHNGHQYALGITSGYDFTIGGFTLGPLGRIFYNKINIDGFDEKFSLNNEILDVDSQETDSLTSTLGFQSSYALKLPSCFQKIRLGVLVPQVRVEWVHEYKNDSRDLEASITSSSQSINISTEDPDRDYCKIGLGMSGVFAGGISTYVYYENILGFEDLTAHNISGGIRIEF